MRSANVDTLPGGFLDLLFEFAPLPELTSALAKGHARRGVEIVSGESAEHVPEAWRVLAEHAALLTLPDDGALPPIDAIDPRPEGPYRPDAQPSDAATSADFPEIDKRALVMLCVALRDHRAVLPPLFDPRTTANPTSSLRRARAELGGIWESVLPRRPELGPYLQLLAADVVARGGDEAEAWSRLAVAREGFADAGNWRAAAAATAIGGDWLACPFASPTTWGLSLGNPMTNDSSLAGASDWPEQSAPSDAAGATEAYDRAEELYRRAGSSRGVAHVAWRRAYLLFAIGDAGAAAEHAEAASNALFAAGDEGAALVARTHATLAALCGGTVPSIGEVVEPIAAWAHGPGSLSHAIGIGRMYARTGRRLGSAMWSCELSLTASSIAGALWAALDRPMSQAQTLSDQAQTLRTLGARRPALVALESALDIATHPQPGRRLVEATWMTQIQLTSKVLSLATHIEDLDAMDRAEQRLAAFDAVLRDPANRATPEQTAMADGALRLMPALLNDVESPLTRAERARDAGNDDVAQREFEAAEAIAKRASGREAQAWLALVRASQRRWDEAAKLHRSWLRKQLAFIGTLRWQLTATDFQLLRRASVQMLRLRRSEATMLAQYWLLKRLSKRGNVQLAVVFPFTDWTLREMERQTRSMSVFFARRVKDLALAREQLDVLKGMADPWWDGLGAPWHHADAEGRLLEAEGHLEAALGMYSQAVHAAEQVRAGLRADDLRVAFGGESEVRTVYLDAARVALRQREALADGDVRRDDLGWTAVRMLELGRSRALMDLLDAADPGLPTAMIDAWRGAQAEVSLARDRLAAALDEQTPDSGRVRTRRVALAEAEQELDGHAERLRVADPRFWQLAGPRAADAVDPAAITASLADGDVVLTFSVDRPDLVSIALTRDGMASSGWSREERRLDALADHLVEACSRGEAWEHAAEELGTILLEPHADVLAAARRLHVIASGSLLTVPFPALRLRGRPLADHLVTSILPSLSAYPHLAAGRRQGLALCVGDPAQMSQRPAPESAPVPLAALPGARLEAEAVAALHGARPLVGPDATKSAVRGRLPDAAVVHLATHGLIDPTSPLASSVQLAQGEALTVAEILSMRLDADLVVLSACQTGTGARAGGDELLGLGRALVAAGARAVVVSLWPVNDACTAVLMSRFHADRVCGLPDDEALHEAQHWIRSLTMEQVHEELTHIARVGETTADYAPQELAATGLGAQRLVSTFRPVRPSPQLVPSHPMIWAPFVLVGR